MMFNSNKKRKLLFVFIVSFITILSLIYEKDIKFKFSVLATHTCTSSSYSGVTWQCTDCENCGQNPGQCTSGGCGLCETCSGGSCVKATAWTDCGSNCQSYGSTDCNTSGDSSGIASWGSACTGSGPVKCWCNSSGSCIGHHDPVCTLSSSQITLKSGYDWSSTTGAKHTISCSPCSNGETSYYTSASSSDCTTCSNGAACGTSTCTCSGTGPLRSCQSQCASCSNGAACGTSTCTCSGTGLLRSCQSQCASCPDGTACNAKNALGSNCTCTGSGLSKTCNLVAGGCTPHNCTQCTNGAACGACYQDGWSCGCSGTDSCTNNYGVCTGVQNASCTTVIPVDPPPVTGCTPVTCSSHNGVCGSTLNSCGRGSAFNTSTTTHSSTWYCPGYKN